MTAECAHRIVVQNNPVNYIDPSGHSWLSSGLRWVEDRIVDGVRSANSVLEPILGDSVNTNGPVVGVTVSVEGNNRDAARQEHINERDNRLTYTEYNMIYGQETTAEVSYYGVTDFKSGGVSLDDISNFSAGMGDSLLMGLGEDLRRRMGIEGVNTSSNAYRYGGYSTFALGVGRLGYAASAKGISLFASSGANAVAGRNTLKTIFRFGLFKNYRAHPYSFLLSKYGSDAAVKAAAGRTNSAINAGGAWLTFGPAMNSGFLF